MKEHHFNKSKFAELMTYDIFMEMYVWHYNQFPNVPDHVKVPLNKKYGASKKANLLTRLIMDYLKMKGIFSERTGNQGQYRVNPRTKKGTWTKGTGTKGTSDIKAYLPNGGRLMAIEVKYGRDKQSEHQKQYQQRIEQMGGIYIIAHTVNDVVNNMI